LAIFGIILDRCPELLFLTKFKNIYSSPRKNIFREDEIFQKILQKKIKNPKIQKIIFEHFCEKLFFHFFGENFPEKCSKIFFRKFSKSEKN